MKVIRSRFLALLLCLCMAMSLLPMAAFAAGFDDTEGHWAEAEIDRWAEAGVVHGDENGEFNPNSNMTRAEAAQVFVNLLRLKKTADLSAYTDVKSGAWYVDPLSKAVAAGIMKGMSETTLAPDTTLSREMMFVMIGRALGVKEAASSDKTFEDSAETAGWAAGYINALVNMGVISGVDATHLAPLDDINRASVMAALDRLIGGYGYENGQTVEIVEGKVTLIVAESVTLTGTADPDLPIVVAGDCAKVDMSKVKGEAVVKVETDQVAITGAPAGTEIVTDDASNVTVNGHGMSSNDDYVVPEKKPSVPSGPSNPSSPTPPTDLEPGSVDKADIDAIIKDGITAVNDKMDYAQLSDLSGERVVTVTISNGKTAVSEVYTDIIDTLVEKLAANKEKVATVTAKAPVPGTAENHGILDLSSETLKADIPAFVKCLIDQVEGSTDINWLDGKTFTVTVSDTETGVSHTDVDYTVKFVLKDLTEDVQAILDQGIVDVNAKMVKEEGSTEKYASLAMGTATAESETVDVTITDSSVNVSKVYNDIIKTLVDALNANTGTVTSITVTKDTTGAAPTDAEHATLTLSGSTEDLDVAAFVRVAVNGVGGGWTLDKLYGKSFTVSIKDVNGKDHPYTVMFAAAPLEDIILSKVDAVNEQIAAYASIAYNKDSNTLTVDIKADGGETKVTQVYNDIKDILIDALNTHKADIDTVVGVPSSAEEQTHATLTLKGTAVEGADIVTFVKALKFAKGSETVTVVGTSEISILAGTTAEFTVNYVDGAPAAEHYTITFQSAQG